MFSPQTARVVEINGQTIILECLGVRLPWPTSSMPPAAVGDTVHLIALKHDSLEAQRSAVAHNLLHELLHPSPNTPSE